MYRILCYGDSNTWGYDPHNGLRFSEKERWPGILRHDLGQGFEVLEDGRNGRRLLDGAAELISSVQENNPLDVIIIYLGINDVCFERDVRLNDIVRAAAELLQEIREHFEELGDAAPDVIMIGFPPINEIQVRDCLYEMEAEKGARLVDELRTVAGGSGCGFIDSGRIIETSAADGIHLEASAHRKLGLFIADYMRTFLKNTNLNAGRR